MSAWTDHVIKWKDCTACPLCRQRDRIVLGRGQVPCDVVFCGEAPGASEDATGEPFIGPAGDVMNQIIDRALPPHVTYAMTNLVACFPAEAKARGDNEPEHSEILACRPRLEEFLAIARPRLLVRVGALAAAWARPPKGVATVDIIHPAATFPPRMARIQAQSAIQHAIVKLRCAVENMLQSGKQITKGVSDASISASPVVPFLSANTDDDVPF